MVPDIHLYTLLPVPDRVPHLEFHDMLENGNSKSGKPSVLSILFSYYLFYFFKKGKSRKITNRVTQFGECVKIKVNYVRKEEMKMISFECDYTQGAHEKVLARLTETNLVQVGGYGSDEFCDEAKEKIKAA